MDVGYFMIFSSYGWDNQPDGETWKEELRLADVAADLGFDCLWSTEHHFADYSVNSGAKCNTAGRFGICLMHNVKRCRHVELYASHAQRERSDRCLEGRWLKHPSHCGEA